MELQIEERIRIATKIGESLYREFKSALQGPPENKTPRPHKGLMQDIAQTLVAFANADGGELFVGIEDDGTITGVFYSDEIIQMLMNADISHVHQETPLPIPRKSRLKVDGKEILYFAIPKSTTFVHLTSDGRCLKRIDRDTVPVSSENISALRLEDGSRLWDRQVYPGATLDDLDVDLVSTVAAQITYGVSVEKCLQYLELAEFGYSGLILKKAALVLFGKDIKKWHPGCHVRFITVNGSERRSGENFNIVKDEVVSANILKLIDQSWERLNYALIQQTYLTDQAQFKQTFLYPQIAVREALINAIVHRNYAIEGRGIEIIIYSDRLEIQSPGMLLSTINLADIKELKGVHESRNPLIARVLREVGFVREMGEGIRRIYDVMRSNALAEPMLVNNTTGFSVSLFHRSMYDPKIKLWLSNFEKYQLTENQMAVMALGFGGKPFSSQDVIDRLGIVDTDEVRKVLTPLRSKGLIVRGMSHKDAYNSAQKQKIPKRNVKLYKVVDVTSRAFSNTPPDTIIQDETEDVIDGPNKAGAIQVDFFVANLPYNVKEEEVYEHLSSFAEVISLYVPSGQQYGSENRGFAFATLAIDVPVKDFLSEFDGKILHDRKIHLRLNKDIRPPA
ncbi:MAG: putative DNA binding domain-containing protein [Anaerolineales bacterium]|nr:putative DNA binding domain-containing protein [Anaerolineales bacterium]